MIQISLEDLLALYAVGGCLAVTAAWAIGHFRRRRRELAEERRRVLCDLCGEWFRDPTDEAAPACPSCGRPTRRDRICRL